MNEIQEYRKASAEALGFDFYKNPKLSEPFFVLIDNGEETSSPVVWHPDSNVNQMLMIEDWLIDQGCAITYNGIAKRKSWIIRKLNQEKLFKIFIHKEDKSKLIAFMKAFMEKHSANYGTNYNRNRIGIYSPGHQAPGAENE